MLHILVQAIEITSLVFVMMVVVDYLDVRTKGRFHDLVRRGRWRQYTLASFLGATPGCAGAFFSVSLYVHGFFSFGAIVATMIATSGDEAFVMFAMFPREALILMALLFALGLVLGRITDWLADYFHFVPSECKLHEYHAGRETLRHYFREHVWKHIVRRHLARVFVWTFAALAAVEAGMRHWQLNALVEDHLWLIFVLSALLGVIPESGPNLIIVSMFASGVIPFSILLTNSIVQDGHGMLPLFSYTMRDALLIKGVNLIFGLLIGGAAYLLGI